MKNSFPDKVAINNLIIKRICEEELSEQENAQLNEWLATEGNRDLYNELLNEQALAEKLMQAHRVNVEDDLKLLMNRIEKPKLIDIRRRTWWRYAAAVALVLVIGSATYFLLYNKRQETGTPEQTIASVTNDVQPGREGAILQLDGGQQIVLDDAANGSLARQGNTDITKQDGLLTYNSDATSPSEVLYNTLFTPRGRQFQLALPDGSKVWLNSASSIRFPNVFTGKERLVEVTGEVYMEIAKDASRPFKVTVNDMQVQVLGTHFNINAYNEEAVMKTTLLEGLVKVTKLTGSKQAAMLKPGQQAQVSGDKVNVVNDADMDAAIAWKNGVISFTTDIKEIMRQVSRWYDVDIEYKSVIEVQELRGIVPRNIPLSDVLKALELSSGLKFSIEGNKVTVQAN